MAGPARLIYGFLSASAPNLNMVVPWQISNRDQAFAMHTDPAKAIETNLKCWAKTNWGERPHNFYYGLDAIRCIFEPSPVAKEKLLNNARSQLKKYFSSLEIIKLEIVDYETDTSLNANSLRFILEVSFKDREQVIKINEIIGVS